MMSWNRLSTLFYRTGLLGVLLEFGLLVMLLGVFIPIAYDAITWYLKRKQIPTPDELTRGDA